jgi:hypothetical protein
MRPGLRPEVGGVGRVGRRVVRGEDSVGTHGEPSMIGARRSGVAHVQTPKTTPAPGGARHALGSLCRDL